MAGAHPPFVCIYASQVAMCIGANRHKKINDAVDIMWQRCDAPGFRAALARNRVRTEDELAQDIIEKNSEVRELVDLTLKTPCASSDEVAKQYDEVARELRAVPLPEDDRRLVDDVLKRNLYTGYGNMHESRVLDYVRDTLGIRCHEDPAFYKVQQGVCSGAWGSAPWYVGGKIDAIDDDRTLLIEIKNRVNRLFYRVPFYEQVQVQAYLHILDLQRGVLVECLKSSGGPAPADRAAGADRAPKQPPPGDDPPLAVNVIPIRRDRELWDRDIMPKLHGFVDFLSRLLCDQGLQDRYLQSKRRSALVTSHINNYIKFAPTAAGGG
jgi:hypothetical protein